MKHLIDKDALVAELNRLIAELIEGEDTMFEQGRISAFEDVKVFINHTLEVKDVDEFKIGETQIYLEDDGGEQPYDGKQWLDLSCTEYEIPKALFKDGDNVEILIRKAQKGE